MTDENGEWNKTGVKVVSPMRSLSKVSLVIGLSAGIALLVILGVARGQAGVAPGIDAEPDVVEVEFPWPPPRNGASRIPSIEVAKIYVTPPNPKTVNLRDYPWLARAIESSRAGVVVPGDGPVPGLGRTYIDSEELESFLRLVGNRLPDLAVVFPDGHIEYFALWFIERAAGERAPHF